jgi:hypothetical protein
MCLLVDYLTSNGRMMVDDSKRVWKKAVFLAILRYCLGSYLEGLNKTTKLNIAVVPAVRFLNGTSSGYKQKALSLQRFLKCAVIVL